MFGEGILRGGVCGEGGGDWGCHCEAMEEGELDDGIELGYAGVFCKLMSARGTLGCYLCDGCEKE